ncbi:MULTISPECIES: hypothetical protein [Chryseobacterium]|uniref:hypothetical protein n=1 Tax=Chryseobacterium TaxID=59732 RepID=UPI0013584E3F|nr:MULTISPECIES: hypothetical protein [Chryseobacterium]MBM7417959.1 hypothetical protein [Chryseobacterium sp. JUb44]MDH6212158.1 hypothetical protein [Chryseobacterium sp. BIGb0186]WSO10777.1 hypothetical protein VUJ64_02395 [Chryseobacterium scophthalmum]
MRINIHNTTKSDKTTDEWIRNDDYRGASWRNFAFAEGLALDLFKDKLIKVPFKDDVLTKEETEKLKLLLENKIKELLSTRLPEPDYRTKIEFLGQTLKLNQTPFGKNNQDGWILDFFRAYQICEECLKENKPAYLSITEEDQ